jgi:hypothetical protein
MPGTVSAEIEQQGLQLVRLETPEPGLDAVHIFDTKRSEMELRLAMVRPLLAPSGFIWVSWPKKASGMATDITEDRIRDSILPGSDLVDVKVCAVDATWSGLKLMVRHERR